ncbi:MAG: energy transducer TonB [Acidobacteriaceae bacterium]
MTYSRINTIFTSQPRSRTEPGFFVVSVLTHGLVLGIGALAIMNTPRVEEAPTTRRYTTRLVKLQGDQPQLRWSPGSSAVHPTPRAVTHTAPSGGRRAAAAASRLLADRTSAPITLVQPDVPPNTLLPLKVPIPLVVMWAPPDIQVKKIVPPPLQKPAVSNVQPSLKAPNHESAVADVQLASSALVSQTIPLAASTTSPIVLPGTGLPQLPQTATNPSAQPMPAPVMSVSNVLLTEGTIALPPINEIASSPGPESLAPGQSDSTSDRGNGTTPNEQNGSGPDINSGNQGNQDAAAAKPGEEGGAVSGSNYGSDSGESSGNAPSVERITHPKDGHFGVVVVGDSVAEQYPEAAGIWADRLAYTVYLHVGADRSWILQYSLPRAVQAGGNNIRPDAPWPYLIMTPHFDPADSDADALLVHGFINAAGRFEHLAIVFPSQFPLAKFVLGALQQWQFRPAAQNGQPMAVEVLLIIPEETE